MQIVDLLHRVVLMITLCFIYAVGDIGAKHSSPVISCETKIYTQGKMSSEVITWRGESALTILQGDRILFRVAYLSRTGYSGLFIKDGMWSDDGSCFAFRMLSSGGHMPYRTPVKIFCAHHKPKRLIDAEAIISSIPNISNIAVGPYARPYLKWLSDTKLQVSVISNDKKSDSGMYIIDLDTMSARKAANKHKGLSHHLRNLTSKRHSPERKAILDAVRRWIREMHHMDVVFVVRYLKTKDGWAWAHLMPQSRDGKNHYEDISALLHQKHESWHIVEIPCAEEETPGCITDPRYFSNLHKRSPDIPIEILPPKE